MGMCKKCLNEEVRVEVDRGQPSVQWLVPKSTNPNRDDVGNFCFPRIPASDGLCRTCHRREARDQEEAMREEKVRTLGKLERMSKPWHEIARSGTFNAGLEYSSVAGTVRRSRMSGGRIPTHVEVEGESRQEKRKKYDREWKRVERKRRNSSSS